MQEIEIEMEEEPISWANVGIIVLLYINYGFSNVEKSLNYLKIMGSRRRPGS
jgi:hypothetical protein